MTRRVPIPPAMAAYRIRSLQTKRFPDWRDPPRQCDCCGAERIVLTGNERVYGRPYGAWPFVYFCEACGAYTGLHPKSVFPLGTLADAATREARSQVHAVFDRLWVKQVLSRRDAYASLADKMGIPVAACHIAMFDRARCEQALQILEASR